MEPVKRRPGRPKGSVNKVDPNKPKRPRAKATVRKTQNAAAAADYNEAGLDGVNGTYYRKRVLEDDEDSWENESLFEDVLDDLAESKDLTEVPGACLPQEAAMYRQMLREIGPKEFCRQTVEAGTITAKKLLTAFGVRPPAFLEGGDDSSYFGLLALVMSRELKKRVKLPFYNTVDDAAELIKKSQNIMVLTGAGISTSLGIPDFRSAHTGLYSQLAQRGLEINDPQEVFDITRFQEDPSIFFSVAKDILPSTTRFSPTHAFIAMLQERGKLLTNYTQNIDNIEANAGIRPDKLVQCHGSFATATCQDCGYQVPGSTIFAEIKADIIPRCLRCVETLRTAGKTKRKRTYKKAAARKSRFSDDDDDGQYDLPEAGIMKPDITFFGEALPDRFNERLEDHDHDKVDLVIVIGTSLKVAPVSEVVPFLPSHIPQIYISREPVSHIEFDIDLLGDCDTVVAELCNRMGWPLFHQMVRPDQKIEVRQDESLPSRHYLTALDAPTPSLNITPLDSPLNLPSLSPPVASGGESPVPLLTDEAGVASVRKTRRLPRTASAESS